MKRVCLKENLSLTFRKHTRQFISKANSIERNKVPSESNSFLTREKVFAYIRAEKFGIASSLLEEIRQSRELVLLENGKWRQIQALPDDAYLDQETGRLRKVGDWGGRSLFAQRELGHDFQINETSLHGKIRLLRPNQEKLSSDLRKRQKKIMGFMLHCTHVDTVTALCKLSQMMNIPTARFRVHQIMDKTTVNTQRCSVEVNDYDGLETRIAEINKDPNRQIQVRPAVWMDSHLKFGEYGGNYYSVLLRHCKAPIRTIVSHTSALCCDGFVNYYPQKFFGYGSFGNQYIGMCVLQNNFSLALAMLAQDECENVKNSHPELGTHKGFYTKKLPWLKNVMSGFSTELKENEDFQAIYMKLPFHIRWKHLLGVRSYLWNLCASQRLHENSTAKIEGDLIGSNGLGVSSLQADCFSNFEIHKEFFDALSKAPLSAPTLNDIKKHKQDNLSGVLLPLPCGGCTAVSHRERSICQELGIPTGNWNKCFGFDADPVVEYRSVISKCKEMTVYSFPEGYCERFNIDINIRTDVQIPKASQQQDCSIRLSKELRNLGLSRNMLLGKWGRVGNKSHLIGFSSEKGIFLHSALREILHLDRPIDAEKSTRRLGANK